MLYPSLGAWLPRELAPLRQAPRRTGAARVGRHLDERQDLRARTRSFPTMAVLARGSAASGRQPGFAKQRMEADRETWQGRKGHAEMKLPRRSAPTDQAGGVSRR